MRLPKWVQELKKDHWLRQIYEDLAWETVMRLKRVKDVQEFAVQRFHESEHVQVVNVESLDLSTGKVTLSVVLQNQLFTTSSPSSQVWRWRVIITSCASCRI